MKLSFDYFFFCETTADDETLTTKRIWRGRREKKRKGKEDGKKRGAVGKTMNGKLKAVVEVKSSPYRGTFKNIVL